MKFSAPFASAFALTLLLAACSTPEEKEAKHQRQLEDQARVNFLALKAREHPHGSQVATADAPPGKAPLNPPNNTAPVKPVAVAKPMPQPKPMVQAKPVAPAKSIAVAKPAPKPRPVVQAKPVAAVKPVAVAKPAPKPKPVPPAKSVATAKQTPPAKPAPKTATVARTGKAPRPDETVYIWNVASQPDARPGYYSAAEVKYARKLGKKPSQLTQAERQWARAHS